MKHIIALFGESGCGKNAIERDLLEFNKSLKKVVRLSTRPMREGEEQGNPYIFLSTEVLQKMAFSDTDNFAEVEEQREWFYATHMNESFPEKSPIDIYIGCYSADSLEILVDATKVIDDLKVTPIKIEVADKTRLIRQLERESEPDCHEICRRYLSDFNDYGVDFDFSYFSVSNNGDLSNTINVILDIIEAEMD